MTPNNPDYKSVWTESLESIVAKFKNADIKTRKRASLRQKEKALTYKDYSKNTLYLSGFEFVFENDKCYFRKL